MRQCFPLVLFAIGAAIVGSSSGCGGGGGGSSTDSSGSTSGTFTDLRLSANLSGVYVDGTNVSVGETLNFKVYGRNEGGAIVEVPSSNWSTNAPASVATVSSAGAITGVAASPASYTVSANATGSTVSTALVVHAAGPKVTGKVTVPGSGGAALAGAKLLFYTDAGALVGSALTGHNGTFRAVLPSNATRFTVDISTSGPYYRQFQVGTQSYLSADATCRAPLPALSGTNTSLLGGDIGLFLRADGPPPPPTGCLD